MKTGFTFGTDSPQPISKNKEKFKPIPPGEYMMSVMNTEIKDNKAGTGKILKVCFRVEEGEYAKRILFANFNIHHSNPKAEEIGRKQLRGLVVACGIDPNKFEDTENLDGVSVIGVVETKFDQVYGESNEIKFFKKIALDAKTKKSVNLMKKVFGDDIRVTTHLNDEAPF